VDRLPVRNQELHIIVEDSLNVIAFGSSMVRRIVESLEPSLTNR
jgi:hypothetical protein